ncbi:MAG TPA: FprA family A-type flavoprotein [Methanosarcinales archaeon]|nr:FprA family A-type flavoprotein [Methanosarcinales archaeon]
MAKLAIIYGTGTGHTGEMAELIGDGARSEGLETEVLKLGGVTEDVPGGGRTTSVDDALSIMDSADAVAIGSSTYELKPVIFVQQLMDRARDLDLSDKVGTAFGSYATRPKAVGLIMDAIKEMGMAVMEPGLQVSGRLNSSAKQECRELGESIAKALSEKK